LRGQNADLFSRFAACYAQLRSMPRGARRALQRKLARTVSPECQRKIACSLAGAALLLALGQGVAQAATIRVTTKQPVINNGDGKCSLIEAIINANDDAATHADCPAGSGADTIVLPRKKTHRLTSSYPYSLNGLPVITSQITIAGRGGKIVRDAAAPEFRLVSVGPSGDLTLKNLTLSGGAYSGNGGGIANLGYVAIENGTVSGNSAGGAGGGIWNLGSISIERSTITRNTADQFGGGGVSNFGTITIVNSVISGNSALNIGGGIVNSINDVLTVEKSTISGNTAGQFGGGVYSYSGTVTIDNSTISGNTADYYGGGIMSKGSGIVTINNGTIATNTAALVGGGVHNEATLDFNRSLVSGNDAPTGREIYNDSTGSVTADDFNLLGFGNDAGIVNFTPGASDIVPSESLDQIIGPLKGHGGPTRTHRLVKGSPGIDAIPASDPGCAGTDQRGVQRPRGSGCDIGAFERRQ
jgi:hypothetical protein